MRSQNRVHRDNAELRCELHASRCASFRDTCDQAAGTAEGSTSSCLCAPTSSHTPRCCAFSTLDHPFPHFHLNLILTLSNPFAILLSSPPPLSSLPPSLSLSLSRRIFVTPRPLSRSRRTIPNHATRARHIGNLLGMSVPIASLPTVPASFRCNHGFNLKQGADAASGSAGDLSPSIIDMDIFSQLLEMDDEDDREFSKSIVQNYFDQAITTFKEMDVALSTKNLTDLSTLGHFLKGSSAAVGVIKVRDSCECMQHYGKCHGEDGVSDLTEEEALEKLTVTLRDVKVQYREAAKALRAFYDEEVDAGEEEEVDDAPQDAEAEAEEEVQAGAHKEASSQEAAAPATTTAAA
ncbi:phosphotransmitter protein [Pseudozyma hubeiensis SY62]|uniref:Phosphotransmitter protein n=1 Tax=Pseudozyma hubeiensis (strain SY62) TaxID=1305764 RepID=R9P998_PSEHS|nr:phosphotransmitter protein [Pseudozyma hubeiensis SY62]GAC94670.1 phosphotransmitter protein [Pseudozyma hubeiensis SY62]